MIVVSTTKRVMALRSPTLKNLLRWERVRVLQPSASGFAGAAIKNLQISSTPPHAQNPAMMRLSGALTLEIAHTFPGRPIFRWIIGLY